MPTMADEIRAKLASSRPVQGMSMADQIRAKLRPPTPRPFAPDSGWASQTSPVAPMVDPRQLTDLPVNLPQTTAVDGSFDPRPKYATLNPQDNAARIGERQFSAGENLAAIPAGLAAGALYGMGEPGTTSLAGKFLTPHLQAPAATPSQFVGTMLPYVAGSAGLTRAIPALANQAITGATQGARFIEGAANIGRGLATDAAVSAGVEGLRQAASGEFDPAELARQALLYPALGAGIGIPMQVGAAKRAGAAIGAEQAAQSEFFERAARQAEAGGGTPAYRETGEIRPWEQYDLPPLAREQSDPRFQLIARRMADARDKARLQGIQLSRQQEAAALEAAEREAAAMSQEQARQELLKHRLQVNQNARAQRGGVQPVLPEPGYRLPQTPGTARRSAEVLEQAPFQRSERLGLPAPLHHARTLAEKAAREADAVKVVNGETYRKPYLKPESVKKLEDFRDELQMVKDRGEVVTGYREFVEGEGYVGGEHLRRNKDGEIVSRKTGHAFRENDIKLDYEDPIVKKASVADVHPELSRANLRPHEALNLVNRVLKGGRLTREQGTLLIEAYAAAKSMGAKFNDEVRRYIEWTKELQYMKENGLDDIPFSFAGGLVGFEQDDEGNVSFDARKALLGVVLGAAGIAAIRGGKKLPTAELNTAKIAEFEKLLAGAKNQSFRKMLTEEIEALRGGVKTPTKLPENLQSSTLAPHVAPQNQGVLHASPPASSPKTPGKPVVADQSVGVKKMVETPKLPFSSVDRKSIPKALQVEVDAISAKTGAKEKIKMSAVDALDDADRTADLHKQLLACLRGK